MFYFDKVCMNFAFLLFVFLTRIKKMQLKMFEEKKKGEVETKVLVFSLLLQKYMPCKLEFNY